MSEEFKNEIEQIVERKINEILSENLQFLVSEFTSDLEKSVGSADIKALAKRVSDLETAILQNSTN